MSYPQLALCLVATLISLRILLFTVRWIWFLITLRFYPLIQHIPELTEPPSPEEFQLMRLLVWEPISEKALTRRAKRKFRMNATDVGYNLTTMIEKRLVHSPIPIITKGSFEWPQPHLGLTEKAYELVRQADGY
jgi:hypothetical protein